jgi:hypothetical protein
VENARKHLDGQLTQHYLGRELADIFDAQIRKGAYHDSQG